MSVLKRNLAANVIGRFVAASLGIVCVPLYVRFVGIEAYGLLGVFATLQAVFSLLDLGLTSTINRELARFSTAPDRDQDARDFVRTLEVVYWGIGLVLAGSLACVAPFVPHWVHAVGVSVPEIRHAALVMAVVFAMQWPLSIYEGGLQGLQKQVLLNTVSGTSVVVRNVGALAVLAFVSPTISAYLAWQIFAYALQTSATALCLWRVLPSGHRAARFRVAALGEVRRFATGLSAAALASLALTQMDKVVLSRMLSLEAFGYYSLAAVAAAGLNYLIQPVFATVFPKLSQLVAMKHDDELRKFYHTASQLAAVAVLPAATVLVFFGRDVMFVWTRSAATASVTHTVVAVLAAGTALNALMNVPYALQLANGWTSLALASNVVATLVLLPAMIVLTAHFGVVGAASIWLLLNVGYVLVNVPIMHRRLLRGELRRWYGRDVGVPLAASLATVAVLRAVAPQTTSVWGSAATLGVVSLVVLTVTAIATPVTAHWLSTTVERFLRRSRGREREESDPLTGSHV